MIKPSRIGEAYCLTGDRNTELAITGIARVCAEDGDRWRPVPVHEIKMPLMYPPGRIAWSGGDAVPENCQSLRTLGLLVKALFGRWVEVDGALAIELTESGHALLDFHYG